MLALPLRRQQSVNPPQFDTTPECAMIETL